MNFDLEVEYINGDDYELFHVDLEYTVNGRNWRGTREEPPEEAYLEVDRITIHEFGRLYQIDEDEVFGEGEDEGIQLISWKDVEEILWEEVKEEEGDAMIDRYEAMMDDDYDYND